MSRKKRLLRAGCITFVFLALIGYFAFSSLLFPPFEGRFKPGIAGVVPRTVDVYLGRLDLRAAFKKFPRLAVLDELDGHPAFEAFVRSPDWEEFKRANGVDEGLKQLDAALAQLPLGLDPLGIFGGRELALAAELKGKGWDQTDWAVYGRVSRVGKLAVAALRYPGLFKLERQGLVVEQDGDIFTLSGASFPRPLSLTRIQDVVVCGTSLDLVRKASVLADTGSQDSLLLAAPYGEHILGLKNRDDRKRDFEVLLDVRALRERWGMNTAWPDASSQKFLPAFLGRLMQIGSVNRVLGVVEFDSGIAVDLRGDFSSELISADQARIYRARSFDRAAIEAIARAAHEDTTFFAYLHGPIGTLLEMVLASMEPALRDNLTEVLVSKGRYKSISQLIAELDTGLHDRLAIMARPNDWGYERDYQIDPATNQPAVGPDGKPIYIGPPYTPEEVFAWTLVVWHENEQKLIDLREYIGANGQKFGLSGRNPQDPGFFSFRIAGNFETREFWSKFVPGTGHIATVNLSEHMMVSNRYLMLEDLSQNLLQRNARIGRLTDRVDFAALLDEMPPSGNLFVWTNPSSGIPLLRRSAEANATRRLEAGIDLTQKRREFEPEARRDLFAGKPRNQLVADEVTRLDQELDRRLIEFRDRVIRENLPAALQAVDREMTYLGSVSAFMAMLDLSEQSFRLAVRAITPLNQR